jgi:antitoxin ParD1/3/4
MSQITVSLPDPKLERFVKSVVEKDALASPSDYILKLIREDQRRRAQERLELLLIEGLDSALLEADDAYWERKDREFEARYPPETQP